MPLRTLFLNCTLKKSPHPSNTQLLVDRVASLMEELGTDADPVRTECVRVVDVNVAFGESGDEGRGDQWPLILDKILAADVLVIATPVWLGERSSVAKLVAERMDATTYEYDARGQHPLYGRVGGAIVTGEGDGAQNCVSSILYNLGVAGFLVPPNADCFYVGEAGPGGPYATRGTDHHYTNERARWMAHNLVHAARMLRDNPFPADLRALSKDAESVSRPAPERPPRV